MKKYILAPKGPLCLFLLFFAAFKSLQAQAAFLEVLDPNLVSLSETEQSRYAALQQEASVEGYWLVNINPIENYLDGNRLSIQLPGQVATLTFVADYVFAPDIGSYSWYGYHADGSACRIDKLEMGYSGSIYDAGSNSFYRVVGLSPNRSALVKYNRTIIEGETECGNDPTDDEVDSDAKALDAGCEGNLIRVLFLYTSMADATSYNPLTVAPAVIAELNASIAVSGLTSADISFAQANVLLLPGFVESDNMGHDLNDFCGMSAVHAMRDANFADIVILLVKDLDPKLGGKAKGISVSSGNAYCIAGIDDAANSFTATHEIGHLIGARHQRCTVCFNGGCDFTPVKSHGYNVGENHGTIMHQWACDKNRIGHWSNPDISYMGDPTGTENNNNAKKLKERAGTVSCFRPAPPANGTSIVTILGPSILCNDAIFAFYTLGFSPSLPPANATYLWEISPNGVNNWSTVSTMNVCPLLNLGNLPMFFVLRATIMVGATTFGVATLQIARIPCLNDSGSDRSAQTATDHVLQVYPNPVSDQLAVEGLQANSSLSVYDLFGRRIGHEMVPDVNNGAYMIQTNMLAPGVYFLYVGREQFVQKIKFVKI